MRHIRGKTERPVFCRACETMTVTSRSNVLVENPHFCGLVTWFYCQDCERTFHNLYDYDFHFIMYVSGLSIAATAHTNDDIPF